MAQREQIFLENKMVAYVAKKRALIQLERDLDEMIEVQSLRPSHHFSKRIIHVNNMRHDI